MNDLPFDVDEPKVQPLHPHIAELPLPKISTKAVDEPAKAKGKKEVVAEEVPVNDFAAFYVAESSWPGQNLFGTGIHGYVTTQVKAKRGYGLKKVVPTPKGYKDDGKMELQVIREVIDIRAPLSKPEHTQTVANCIVYGAVLALEYVAQLEEIPKSVCVLIPRKNLAIFMTKGYPKAIEDGYVDGKGNPLAFKEVLDSYVRVLETLTSKGCKVYIEYVSPDQAKGLPVAKANANDAVLAAQKDQGGEMEPHCIVSPPEGYWNHDHGRHPLLGKSRMIFKMADKKVVENDHVFLMDFDKASNKKEHLHKLEIEVGQLLPSASYCVAKINSLDPIIAAIQQQHTNYLDTKVERLGVLFLDAVFKPGAHSVMQKVGADYLHSTTYVTDLLDSYGAMYTHELNPARQAHRAWNTYLDMQSIVQHFLADRDRRIKEETGDQIKGAKEFFTPYGIFMSTQITSEFIDVTEDAKGRPVYKASRKVETPNTSLKVDAFYLDDASEEVRQASVTLSIGIDMPKRNAIAAMASDTFEAYVLVRQDTPFTVRHYVVVTNGDEYGIWAAPFANRTFVRK